MTKVALVSIGQDVSLLKSVLENNDFDVDYYLNELDFRACFDSDLLVVTSVLSLDILNDFWVKNRLGVLIERRLCGGLKVLCTGSVALMLFNGVGRFGTEKFLHVGNNGDFELICLSDKDFSNIDFLQQWNANISSEQFSGKVRVCELDEGQSFLNVNDEVFCTNQILVFEHPSVGLDCKYTKPPTVAYGCVAGRKVILSVENGALSALLFDCSKNFDTGNCFSKILKKIFCF